MMQCGKDFLWWSYWYPYRLLVQRMPIPIVYAGCRIMASCMAAFRSSTFRPELDAQGLVKSGDDKEARRIIRETWFVRICTEVDVLLFPRFNPGNIAKFTSVEGMDRLEAALKKGRGVMLLLAHYGANQMVMSAIGHRGYKMCQLGAPPSAWDRIINKQTVSNMKRRGLQMRAELEKTLPARILDPEKQLKESIKCLKSNGVLGVAADGAAGTSWISCPFIGRNIRLGQGPFSIMRRIGCEGLPAFMVRDSDGRQRLEIGKPLVLSDGMDEDAVLNDAARQFALILEDYVRRRPSHYLYFLAFRRKMAAREGDPPLLE